MTTTSTKTHERTGSVFEVFKIAYPLVLVASSNSMKLFCDRTMLAHYSKNDMSASFTGGITFFTLLVFFIAIINYCSVFVSQYFGAGDHKKVGLSVWQGIVGAFIAFIITGTGYWWSEPLFNFINHDASLRSSQIDYVSILFATSIFPLMMTALTAFWAGQGRTWMVLFIEAFTVVLNIILNFLCIFGTAGFPETGQTGAGVHALWDSVHTVWAFTGLPHIPEMGIVGAAVGTAVSTAIGTSMAFALFLRKKNRDEFGTWPKKFFDYKLFKRQLHYGMANGIRAVLDVGAFNVFVLLLAHYGNVVRDASTITFSINALAFIPLFGFGHSVSILVGQSVGAERIDVARRSVKSGMIILAVYLLVVVSLLVFFEELPLSLFNIADEETLMRTTRFMMFVAFTLIMNGVSILYSSAVSGAGDTKFPMKVTMSLSWGIFAIPLLIIYKCGGGYLLLWHVFILHTIPKAGIFYWRYRSGKWREMRVIEKKTEAAAE